MNTRKLIIASLLLLVCRVAADDARAQNAPAAGRNSAASSPGKASPTGKRVVKAGGVLNGRATTKITPEYPAEAKANGVGGLVRVRVFVDEQGAVAEAAAVEGPEELRAAAVEAAKQWTFPPTMLSGTPVAVTGFIVFNFKL